MSQKESNVRYDLMNQEYVTQSGKAVIKLLARDINRNLHIFSISDYTPYFWAVVGQSLEKDLLGRPIKLVTVTHPSDVRKVRKEFLLHDEADILFPWRYLIDKGIYCGFSINKNHELKPAESLGVPMFMNLFDIEVETPPEILARPHNPKWPIVSIQSSNTYNDSIEIMMLDTKLDGEPIPIPEYAENCEKAITRPVKFSNGITVYPKVYLYDNERLMIHDSVQRVAYYKFDGHSGYNSNMSDVPYWIRRGNVLGVNMRPLSPFGRVECRERKDTETGKVRLEPFVKGSQLFDYMKAYEKWSGGRQGAKLVVPGKDFAQTLDFHLIMERECEFYYTDLGDKVADSRVNHPVEWLEYCCGDAYALKLLESTKGIIHDFDVLRRLVGVPLEWSLHNSRLIDMRLLRLRDKPLPSKRHFEKTRVKGALVLDPPPPGVPQNVVIIDTKALYPMLIRVFNLSPEVLDPKGEIVVGPMEDGTVLRFRKSPVGLLAKAVTYDMENREALRRQLKTLNPESPEFDKAKLLETKYKFLACSYYGVTGYENFRLYSQDVRKAITFLGREAILECKRECEKNGYPVIYGDTDSMFVKLSGSFPQEGRMVENIINQTLRRIAWKHGAYFTLEAKFETFCKRIMFVPKVQKFKGKIITAKKRYAYVDEKDNLYVVGLAPRRSSTPVINRRNILEWLTLVLSKQDVPRAIKLVRTLYESLPTYPLNMIGLPRGVHKAVYESRNPWRIGMDFMHKHYGKVFREDKKPLLIYLQRRAESYAVCVTEWDKELPSELQRRIDWAKMRDKVITAYYKPLFEAIGISWEQVIYNQKGLTSFL